MYPANRKRPRNELLRFLTMGTDNPMEVPVLALYVDESKDAHTFLVAGLLAQVEAWDEFIDDWNTVLAIPPAMPYWHQSEAYARQGPFSVLSRVQLKEREARLARVITKLSPTALSVTLSNEIYRQEIRGKVSPPPATDSESGRWRNLAISLSDPPYYFMHMGWIEGIRRNLDEIGTDEKVRIVIERSTRRSYDNAIEYAVRAMQRTYEREGATLPIKSVQSEFGKDPQTRQLEAADMFAWGWRRHLTNRLHGGSLRPHHVVGMMRRLGPRALMMNATQVRKYVDDMNDKWVWGPRWDDLEQQHAEAHKDDPPVSETEQGG